MSDPFYDRPDVKAWLTAPGLRSRLAAAFRDGLITREQARVLQRDVEQVYRAANGHRSQPGSYLDDPTLPQAPMPFAGREQFHPTRGPGSTLYQAVGQLEDAATTEALQQRMGTDLNRRDDPISLRDQIEAAASLSYPKE